MSWDVLLQRFPENTAQPEQVPDDYQPPPVGSRAEVVSALRKLLRNVDLTGDSFVSIDRARFAMEIGLGDEEPCSQLFLTVHDDHAEAMKTILRVADHFGMRVIDCSSGEFIEAGRRREASEERQEKQPRSRRKLDQPTESPPPQPPLNELPGVVTTQRCVRYMYLSLRPGESPKQLQNAVHRQYIDLVRGHPEWDAGIMGPWYVLTLPDGQALGDFRIARYPTMVTETEAEMIPRVQKGVEFVHEIAAASGRRCGVIENGSTFVCDDDRRIPLAQCAYRKLVTDADYARKAKGKKK
jgi:hypothetical protein